MTTSVSRAAWAFILLMVYMGATVGLRMYTQHKRTGSAGFNGLAGKPGSAESIGGILFVTAGAAGLRLQLVDVAPAALCNAFRYNYPDLAWA